MAKSYHTAIVGESKFQPAVRRTTVGDYVDIVIEEGNPHAGDEIALRVDNSDGDTIGYIAEDHWLRRAILDEGKGVLAKVDSKAGRLMGTVLRTGRRQHGSRCEPDPVRHDAAYRGTDRVAYEDHRGRPREVFALCTFGHDLGE